LERAVFYAHAAHAVRAVHAAHAFVNAAARYAGTGILPVTI
jgi:hypothetical protein